MTHSRLIPLIITNYEIFFLLHELEVAKLYISTNILISKLTALKQARV